MKHTYFHARRGGGLLFLFLSLYLMISQASGESMEEMINQFEREFEAVKPAPNSSINSDYKIEQAALGTLYTTRAIHMLFEQNKEMVLKYDEMLVKYNEMLLQNKEIIRLLTIMAKDEGPQEQKRKKESVAAPLEE